MIDHLVHTDFKVVDKREGLNEVMGYLHGDTERTPIITDQERPYGVLNERGLMKTRLYIREHVGKYTVGTGTLDARASVSEAIKFFANTPVAYAPVMESGRLVGYVAALDLLDEVKEGPGAVHLMDEVPILKETQSAGEALHHLRETKAGIIPVVDEAGRLAGVIDRRSIIPISIYREDTSGHIPAGGEREHLVDIEIRGLMSTDLSIVRPDASFEEVKAALKGHGFCVVEHEGRPLGVILPAQALQKVARK